ncbi:MAG: lipocalin-like domain-containing protein [Alphaproteobacteria bacterium]|nr:lipocalin-like domain-containing protein [Alphaproteobacteria bacterium]
MSLAEQLVGAWALVSFEVQDPDRGVIQPYGPQPRGRLHYQVGGQMCALLVDPRREPLGAEGLETAHRAPAEAKARAFDGLVSYAGRWSLEGEEVVHAVELASLPELAGRAQRRHVWIQGDRLTLSYTQVSHAGLQRRYALEWRRLS